MPTPAALCATPCEGAIPVAWQSQFHGILEQVTALLSVFGTPK